MKRMLFFFAVLAVAGVWLWLNLPTLAQLHVRWVDVGDSYVLGYPLIVAGLWLVWQRRTQLQSLPRSPSWLGVLLFAMVVVVILAGRLIQLQIIQQVFLPVSLWCAIVAIFGWRVGYIVLLPVALQYFGMPIWDFLIEVLKGITVFVSSLVLHHMHIPALIESSHIYLTSGVVTVADSCSGLNLLLAVLLIAILQVQLGHYSAKRRIIFLTVAAIIGLLNNWIRVIALILIAHYSRMQNPLVYDHASFGWWIYAFNLLPLFWVAHRLQDPSGAAAPASPLPALNSQPRSFQQCAALIAIVLAGLWGSTLLAARSGKLAAFELEDATRNDRPDFTPQYQGYDLQQSWVLRDARYELTALTYLTQLPEKKLIYYSNVIAAEERLALSQRAEVAEGRRVNVSVVRGAESRIVWWYYWVDGHVAISPLWAKLYQLQAMVGGDPSASLIALSRACHNPDCSRELQEWDNGNRAEVFSTMFSLRPIHEH